MRAGLLALAGFVVLEAPGCGGIVDLAGSREHDGGFGGAGDNGSIDDTGGKPGSFGGKKGTGGKTACGNGRVESGEACDGADLGSATCATATMGLSVYGVLRCSGKCTFDTTNCYRGSGAGGAYSAGGYTGAGGRVFGSGGRGSGGAYPYPDGGSYEDYCYDSGGVFIPPSGCGYGYASNEQCMGYSSADGNVCVRDCSCKTCASEYVRCQNDPYCGKAIVCAASHGCSSLEDCYKLGCSEYLDAAGGFGSKSAYIMRRAISCMATDGCAYGCYARPI